MITNIIQIPIFDTPEICIAWVSVIDERDTSPPWRTAQHSAGRKALANASLVYGLDSEDAVFKIVDEVGGKLIDAWGETLASASIAHTGNIALAVVGPRRFSLGIDVEHANRIVGPDVLRLVSSEDELATFTDLASDAEMLAVWTKKEAVGKATGHGLAVAKETFPIDNESWSWNSRIFSVISWNAVLDIRSYNISLAVESGSIADSVG